VKRNKLQSETENYYKQLKYLMLFHPMKTKKCKMLYYYRERDVVPVSRCMGMGAKECPSNTTLNVACTKQEPRSCHPVFWDYEKR